MLCRSLQLHHVPVQHWNSTGSSSKVAATAAAQATATTAQAAQVLGMQRNSRTTCQEGSGSWHTRRGTHVSMSIGVYISCAAITHDACRASAHDAPTASTHAKAQQATPCLLPVACACCLCLLPVPAAGQHQFSHTSGLDARAYIGLHHTLLKWHSNWPTATMYALSWHSRLYINILCDCCV